MNLIVCFVKYRDNCYSLMIASLKSTKDIRDALTSWTEKLEVICVHIFPLFSNDII